MKIIKRILCIISLFAAAAIFAGAKKPSQLTVVSYNIRLGEANDGTNSWKYRYPMSAMMIEDQDPDIFGLQEAYIYQKQYLEEYTKGYKSIGVGREDGKREGEIMAIFYKTKRIGLLKWGTFWLSETPEKPSMGWDAACMRTATWALMKDKKSGKKFYYVNTHLDHMGRKAQENGLGLIVERIAEMNSEGYPMVLTGDFNVEPDDPVLDGLKEKMQGARETAVNTDKSATFNGWGKSFLTIDHIFYSGFSSCPVFEVINKPYGGRAYISDHFPVKAVLVF
jgi:hypothetical protein